MIRDRLAQIFAFFNRLLLVLTVRQRILFVGVLILTIINALLQAMGVSIIVPLVTSLINPEELIKNEFIVNLAQIIGVSEGKKIVPLVCVITMGLYLFKNTYGVVGCWINQKYGNMVQRGLSLSLLGGYLRREYDFFLKCGTAQVLRDVREDTEGVYSIVTCILVMITELLTIGFIFFYICILDWHMAGCLLVLAGGCLFVIFGVFKNKMRENGTLYRKKVAETQRAIIEAVEGIKEIQVMRKQQFYYNMCDSYITEQLEANLIRVFGQTVPTYLVEAVFVSGITGYVLLQVVIDPNNSQDVPKLAAIMFGAIRMLPSLGRISSSINTISYNAPSLQSVYCNLKRNNLAVKKNVMWEDCRHNDGLPKLNFEQTLVLDDVSWHYEGSERKVLDGLNMVIKKGQSVGLIGASGAGKTTVADIILGLHMPQKGKVCIDGVDVDFNNSGYSRLIGYVPQTVFLIDGTVKENVAFGVARQDIDESLVWECLKQAHLAEFVRNLECGLETIVGERGVKFSGGQRQRIAIARALYRKPEILIMDEATSALDNDTETAVMESIENLHGTITMIVIAHRLTTVKKCDKVYEIKEGKAIERNEYCRND